MISRGWWLPDSLAPSGFISHSYFILDVVSEKNCEMSTAAEKKNRSCGRGVLKLKSLEPCPRPRPGLGKSRSAKSEAGHHGQAASASSGGRPATNGQRPGISNHAPTTKPTSNNGMSMTRDIRNFPVIKIDNKSSSDKSDAAIKLVDNDMIAKYSYTANPDKPGGFEELTIKQGEKLWFVEKHPYNPHWIKVKTENGATGFAPTSYTMNLEKTVTALPWLEEKRRVVEAEKQEQESQSRFGMPEPGNWTFKPYQSAYTENTSKEQKQSHQWYCDVCDKSLNGPQPYKAHMVSKAHKEEVEAQKYR